MDLKWREANCAAAKGEKMYHHFTEQYLDALLSSVVFYRQGFATPQTGNDSKDGPSVLL